MIYRDRTLRADVITPHLKVREDGLYSTWNEPVVTYPYDKLFIYHFGLKMTYPLINASSARLYFQVFNADYSNDCGWIKQVLGVPLYQN